MPTRSNARGPFSFLFSVILLLLQVAEMSYAARIKDLACLEGVRRNQLVGYGLVVGLQGTGDGKKARFTVQSMASMLERMGMTVGLKDINVDNVAAVMVTADLPPFARSGSRIDVLVSSIGDADSLYGGTLLMTPLRGADGGVYAVAQGALSIGGILSGGKAASVQKNFPTVGRVVQGALVEREVSANFAEDNTLNLILNMPDFTTAARMSEAINDALLSNSAQAVDPGRVSVTVPERYEGDLVGLVTLIEGLDVNRDMAARVVINERTGTVVIGDNVRLSTVAISHGNLSIEIKESPTVSQPMPFSSGETVVTPNTSISVTEERSKLFLVKSGSTIGELVKAMNALGVSPRDLITVFQAIKAAGALDAELEIM